MAEKGTGTPKSPSRAGRKGEGRSKRVPVLHADLRAELEERLRFEELISDLSARFVGVEAADLDREIEEAQKKLCEALGLDRSTIGLFSGPEESPMFTHSWAAAGFEPNPLVAVDKLFPWIAAQVKLGHVVRFTSIEELPEEASADKETLMRGGPKSSLTIPLQVGKRVFGGLSFGMLRVERVWHEELLGRLRHVAQIFASALERRRAEEDLRESEAKLALATESAGVGIWAYEIQKQRFWTTPTNRAIFGLPGDGPIPLDTFIGLVHPDDRQRVGTALREALDAGKDVSEEYRIVLAYGEIRWISSRGGSRRNPSGKADRLTGVSIDITPRKLAEEAAARATQEFRAMFELSAMGIAQVDPATERFVRVNQKFCEITGYSEEELRELTFRDITYPGDPPNDPVAYAKVLAGEAKDWTIEKRYRRKDGSARWVIARGSVIHDEGGRPRLTVTGIADITDRKRAEQELWENQQLISAIFSSLFGHVAVIDRGGTIVAANDAWVKFALENGGDLERVGVGANYLDVCRRAAADGSTGAIEALQGIEAVLSGSLPEHIMEYPCPAPLGDRWFERVVHPLKRPEGGAVITHVSTTGRRETELEVVQLRQEISHVTRVTTMGEMTASLAHELNQPLTAIRSNAQAALQMIAQGKDAPGELKDILTDIVNDDRRASEMIRRLRSLMKKGDFGLQPLDLNTLIREVVPLARPDAILRDISLDLDLAPVLPPVQGDGIHLQQVLLNLVMNAMEALKDQSRREIRIATGTLDQGEVWVAVTDTGPGIRPENRQRLFEPFFTTKSEGMGMGLVICQSIARAHGGRIVAENGFDGGASFTLVLPAMPQEA